MNNTVRNKRLKYLLDVALVHEEYDGHDTPLNGISRNFNMNAWDCGTSACLLGSYVLSKYGKLFFEWSEDRLMPEPRLRGGSSDDPYEDAAEHFGITHDESLWLFSPDEYDGVPRDDEGRIPADVVAERTREIIARYER